MSTINITPFYIFRLEDRFYLLKTHEIFYSRIDESQYQLLLEIRDQILKTGSNIQDRTYEEITILEKLSLCTSDNAPSDMKGYLEKARNDWKLLFPTLLNVQIVSLFVTYQCNMCCVYCHEQYGKKITSDFMTIDVAKKAIDWTFDMNDGKSALLFRFHGGEPLLNYPIIKESIAYIKSLKSTQPINFQITTNCSLLTDEIINDIASEGIDLTISFDGPPEYQRKNRIMKNGLDSYTIVVDKIRKVVKRIPNVTINATLWDNADEDLVKKEITELGIKNFYISTAFNHHSFEGLMENTTTTKKILPMREYSFDFDSMKDLVKKIIFAIQYRDKDAVKRLCNCDFYIRMIFKNNILTRKPISCDAGKSYLAIGPEGKIYPCNRFSGLEPFCMGSIFSSEPLQYKCFEQSQLLENKECSNCFANIYCGGICMYENLFETGNPFISLKTRCEKRRKILELAVYTEDLLNVADHEFLIQIGLRNDVQKIG